MYFRIERSAMNDRAVPWIGSEARTISSSFSIGRPFESRKRKRLLASVKSQSMRET